MHNVPIGVEIRYTSPPTHTQPTCEHAHPYMCVHAHIDTCYSREQVQVRGTELEVPTEDSEHRRESNRERSWAGKECLEHRADRSQQQASHMAEAKQEVRKLGRRRLGLVAAGGASPALAICFLGDVKSLTLKDSQNFSWQNFCCESNFIGCKYLPEILKAPNLSDSAPLEC